MIITKKRKNIKKFFFYFSIFIPTDFGDFYGME